MKRQATVDEHKDESRVSRKRAARSDQVVACAMQLAASDGLEAVSVNRVAKELDVAVAGLYRYFPSKSALYAVMQRKSLESLLGRFDEISVALARREKGLSARARLLSSILLFPVGFFEDADVSPARFAIIDSFLSTPRQLINPEDTRVLAPALGAVVNRCENAFEAAVAGHALAAGNATLRTHTLWGCAHGLTHMKKLERMLPAKITAARLMRESLTAMCVGWGAPADDVKAAWAHVTRRVA